METITNNEFLNYVLETEVWKEISENESMSMDILDKYADKLDWDEISKNRNIIWTLDGINKFAGRLNWSDFSQYCHDHIINEVTLQKFASRWDWKAIICVARKNIINFEKTIVLDASEIISIFASYTSLLKTEVVKLNRIKAVFAEADKQGKWLDQQLGKDPTTVSKWCTNTIQPDLKTLAEIAELLNVNIRELLVNTK